MNHVKTMCDLNHSFLVQRKTLLPQIADRLKVKRKTGHFKKTFKHKASFAIMHAKKRKRKKLLLIPKNTSDKNIWDKVQRGQTTNDII